MVKLNDGMIISINGALYKLHELSKDYEYTVSDEADNVLDCIVEDGMSMAEIADEIKAAAGRPRETPDGDTIIKRQHTVDMVAKIGRAGSYTLMVPITEQAKALGLEKGDHVRVILERLD